MYYISQIPFRLCTIFHIYSFERYLLDFTLFNSFILILNIIHQQSHKCTCTYIFIHTCFSLIYCQVISNIYFVKQYVLEFTYTPFFNNIYFTLHNFPNDHFLTNSASRHASTRKHSSTPASTSEKLLAKALHTHTRMHIELHTHVTTRTQQAHTQLHT